MSSHVVCNSVERRAFEERVSDVRNVNVESNEGQENHVSSANGDDGVTNGNVPGEREMTPNGGSVELVWTDSLHPQNMNSSLEGMSTTGNGNGQSQQSSGGVEEGVTPKLHGRKILEFMRMSGRDKGLIGIKKMKGKKLNELQVKHRGHVVRIVKNIVMRVCESFLPMDSRSLLCAASNELGVKNDLIQKLISLLRVCKLRSLEKRMMRCMILGIVEGNEAKRLIAVDTSYNVYDDSESDSDRNGEIGEDEDGERAGMDENERRQVEGGGDL